MTCISEHPQRGDYIKLTKDSESFTTVDWVGGRSMYYDGWEVLDIQGEEYIVVRFPKEDNQLRKAWKEVHPC